VIITGKRGSGRKRLARLLEERLFQDGKLVYYLGMGSVVYGVDADIAAQPDGKSRSEHVRRMAEVAHLFLDAGLILIITAVELSQADLKLFHAALDERLVEVVWVGDEVSTDIAIDLPVGSREDFSQAVQSLQRLLRDHGILFRP
jgi:bifunctional enzyme CysN/CysC